ncbi:MAG: hypothetical protein SO386_00565 [Eubacteriales bacterium]|nr:hypothetical protein [Eubacteriales bacterium]
MYRLKSALIVEYKYMRLLLFVRKNGVFSYFHEERIDYDGFNGNGFINPDDVFSKIQHVYADAERYGSIDKHAVVVLPGVFFKYARAEQDTVIESGAVTENDVRTIISLCGTRLPSFEIVQKRPIIYKTLSNPYINNPIGQKADRLKLIASIEYLRLGIKELFDTSAKRLGKIFEYTSFGAEIAAKAEKTAHLPERIIITLADGNIDVALCNGGVPVKGCSDMLGAKHVCYSLAEELGVDDATAEEIANGMNLNLNFTDRDFYYVGGEKYSVSKVNSCVAEAFIYLAGEVKKYIDEMCEDETPPPVFLTGSSLCSVRGVKDVFEDETGCEITILDSETLNLTGCGNYVAAAVCESTKTIDTVDKIKQKLKSIFGSK